MRSYGSGYGGSGGVGGLRSTFDSGNRYSDRAPATTSSYRPSSASRSNMDRSLSYAALNAGAVSSIRDKFDTPIRSRDRYPSVDRYTSRSADYNSRGGYGSDMDVASVRSYGSYGRAPSSSNYSYYGGRDIRREASREPSPSRFSRASNDYGGGRRRTSYGGKDFGASPTADVGRTYDTTRYGSNKYGGGGYNFGSSYVPSHTPTSPSSHASDFRRPSIARTNEPNLTPFVSRLGRTLSNDDTRGKQQQQQQQLKAPRPTELFSRPYERTHSRDAPSTLSPKPLSSPRDEKTARTPDVTSSTRRGWQQEEEFSSESCDEPDDPRMRNTAVTYRTSRATSPMEIDREGLSDEIPRAVRQKRRRLISRTKTKEYPRKNYKRRRDRAACMFDAGVQVDTDEMDKLNGGARYIRNKLREKQQERDKPKLYGARASSHASSQSKQQQSRPSSGYSSYATKAEAEAKTKHAEEKQGKPLRSKLSPTTKELPKQSAFRRLERPGRESELAPAKPDAYFYDPQSEVDLQTFPGSEYDEEYEEPTQTSFIGRMRQWEDEEAQEAEQEVVALTPENLSLRDTINKVKTWKEQMRKSGDSLDQLSPKGRQSMKKQTSRADSGSRGPSRQPSHEVMTSDNSEDECFQPRHEMLSPPGGRRKNQRSASPYDNLRHKRDVSPYENVSKKLPAAPRIEVHQADDMCESRDSFADYEDAMTTEDDEVGHLQDKFDRRYSYSGYPRPARPPSTSSLTRLDKSTSVTSLPDLMNENNRSGPFISSSVKDIDSFLDFDTTEDDRDLWSDDEYHEIQRNRETQRQLSSSIAQSSSPEVIEEVESEEKDDEDDEVAQEDREERPKRKTRKDCAPDWIRQYLSRNYGSFIGPETGYYCDYRNIDDYLGPECAGACAKYVGDTPTQPTQLKSPSTPKQVLPEVVEGSCTSILDTPVPETPDVPLEPRPVFFRANSSQDPSDDRGMTSQSMDNLEDLDPDGKLSLKRLAKKQNIDKTKSESNLDDLDSILTSLSRPRPRRRKPLDEFATFNLFTREAKDDLQREVATSEKKAETPQIERQESEDVLVDVSDVTSPMSPPPQPSIVDGVYPVDYSAEAVREAIRLELEEGTISTQQLLEICKRHVPSKPPWIVAEEERTFSGFRTIDVLLESLGVDVKKVGFWVIGKKVTEYIYYPV